MAVDYSGTSGVLKVDTIQPQTDSLTINGAVYIPYTVWSTLGNNNYNQYATGYGTYLNQYQ